MNDRIWLDFETFCELSLPDVGLYKYINHPSFDIICGTWAINDQPINLWLPHHGSVPEIFQQYIAEGAKVYAHNAEFDMRVWERLPETLGIEAPRPAQWVDTMALATTFGYPAELEEFCKAIGVEGKLKAGATLIKRLTQPRTPTAKNLSRRRTIRTHPEEFKSFFEYAIQDIAAMRAAVKRLPAEKLSNYEHIVWAHTLERNRRGAPLDIESVRRIYKTLNSYKKYRNQRLPILTGGEVTKGTQIQRIKRFLQKQGMKVDSLAAEIRDELIESPSTPPVCKEILEIRRDLSRTSTAKFLRMLQAYEPELGVIRGNEVYHRAHTGRFAGKGVQLHNLMSAQHDDPNAVLELFKNCDFYEVIDGGHPDVMKAAAMLVRHMIATGDNQWFIAADYSSIENRVLHWGARDWKTVDEFKRGLDQYKTYASDAFNVPYDKVTKDQRQNAKPDVLGLGYGGGFKALIGVAKGYGVILDPKTAQKRVDFYRSKYRKVVSFWYRCSDAAKEAMLEQIPISVPFGSTEIEFRYTGGYLFIVLPSGRRLSYPGAKLSGGQISYMSEYSGGWLRVHTHPGKIVENIIQAVARDILVHGMLCVEKAGFPVFISVHDECVARVYYKPVHEDLDTFCDMMCITQDWAKGLPLKAEGYIDKRYRKG